MVIFELRQPERVLGDGLSVAFGSEVQPSLPTDHLPSDELSPFEVSQATLDGRDRNAHRLRDLGIGLEAMPSVSRVEPQATPQAQVEVFDAGV